MNVLIAGGTGFIGNYLKNRFEASGHIVRLVSRSGMDVSWNLKDLIPELEKTDVLINLAGKSINSRFTEKNKELILQSRLKTTGILNEAVAACKNPPVLWINASATGIYKHTGQNQTLNESSMDFASDFLGNVVQLWEREFFGTSIPGVRKTAIRTSVVLGKSGGAYPIFKLLAITGLGGKQGSGAQMVSWIHIEDYYRIILFIIEESGISGVINASAPFPVTNQIFMKTLRKAKRFPVGIPAPEWAIKLGTGIVGVDSSLILASSNVNSEILIKNGFEFRFPTVEKAFLDLIQ